MKANKIWDRFTVSFDQKIVNRIEQSAKVLRYCIKEWIAGQGMMLNLLPVTSQRP